MAEAESFEATLKKANAGDPEAQNDMGRLVISKGGPNARKEAETWFRRAAEQGLSKATHNLGVLYFHEGARAEAMKYFLQAAKAG